MSLEADAMQENADALEMAGTGDLVSAGVSAFSALTPAFGTKAGKVADGLIKDDPTLTKTAANKLAAEMIADGTVPQTGFQKGLASVGGALKNAFSKTKNTTDELFSEENMANLTEKAKQAGVSIKEFIANLLKKK